MISKESRNSGSSVTLHPPVYRQSGSDFLGYL